MVFRDGVILPGNVLDISFSGNLHFFPLKMYYEYLTHAKERK